MLKGHKMQGKTMEADVYVLLVAGVAAFGGYRLGHRGERDEGITLSIAAAMMIAVPMGLWFVFNLFTYLIKGGRRGFEQQDVAEAASYIAVGVFAWLGGMVARYVVRHVSR